MCKGNNAANVRIKTPTDKINYSRDVSRYAVIILIHCAFESGTWLSGTGLDSLVCMGVFIITYEDRAAFTQNPCCQDPGSPQKRNASSTGWDGTRSVVPGRELLRSAGSYPGQIRSAAPSAEGRDAD